MEGASGQAGQGSSASAENEAEDEEGKDIQNEFDDPVAPVTIKFKEVLLKQFIGHTKSSKELVTLDNFEITATTLAEFTKKLWEKIQQQLRSLAIKDKSTGKWTPGARPQLSDVLMLPAYIHLKRSSRTYILPSPFPTRGWDTPASCLQAPNWPHSHRPTHVAEFQRPQPRVRFVHLQAWHGGNQFQRLDRVQVDVLGGAECGSRGTAAEAVIAQVMKQLEELHPQISADQIFYRLWASHVIKQPIEEREDWLRQLPPKEIIHFFSASPSELLQRAETAKACMSFGIEMIGVMDAQIDEMKKVHAELGRRIEGWERQAQSNRRIAQGFINMLPTFVGVGSTNALAKVTNLADKEHQSDGEQQDAAAQAAVAEALVMIVD